MKKLEHFDSWEVYRRRISSIKVRIREGKKEGTFLEDTENMAVRGIKYGRMFFAHGSGQLPLENMDIRGVEYLERESYQFPERSELPKVDAFDKNVMNEAEGFGEEFSRRMEEAALSWDGRVKGIRQCWYRESIIEDSIENSKGVSYSFRRTNTFAYIELKASDGSSEEMGYSYRVGIRREDLSPETIGREAAKKAVSLLGGKPLKTGGYRALIKGEVVAEMLSFFAPSLLGENVIKGKSLLKGRLGENVVSSAITLIDTGLRGAFPSPFDGEGTPSRENIVIENGKLNMFLYDILWATKAGTASTGNSVRPENLSSPPSLSITNLLMKPGEESPLELLEREGGIFVIEEVMGLHLANPVTGEFSLGASGTFHGSEGGFGVKSITITGNILDLLQRVIKVFNDMTVSGRIGSPSILVENISVVGS